MVSKNYLIPWTHSSASAKGSQNLNWHPLQEEQYQQREGGGNIQLILNNQAYSVTLSKSIFTGNCKLCL